MQFISLASGSKGNCSYIASDAGAFLIDCGISLKRIEQALAGNEYGASKLQGVFLTHEHRDHIAGLGPLLRRYGVPCYGTEGTLAALDEKTIGKVSPSLFRPLDSAGVTLADFDISWSPISHDASEPVSYQIHWQNKKIGMCTDVGTLSDDNLESLVESDILLLEANHDKEMLVQGPYPEMLKRRIAGSHGHLSNEDCARALEQIIGPKTKHVVLAHLSDKNNRPQRAFDTIRNHLQKNRTKGGSLRLWVAQQHEPLMLSI